MAVQRRKRYAEVLESKCVACGSCAGVCPRTAISVPKGVTAKVDKDLCVGCGLCEKICPACVIEMITEASQQEEN
ncbi:4Fe-4S dicluster-binding protein [Anaeromicropila populeti]|uniref:4Fe-4S dicluster domain-containing protein n=1 Tax=Anaeromicropila populeti TaxID=37658 RepID=A0A1I6HIK6_9FIRM|nr:4Fe-4S dicluster-binding protein [Anaeromicropila populeti]SFR54194.1 4Fe-4S dicluster domain-containing protein [Anaeromicropila populeti]